jgi:hypothetical protein
MENHYEPQNSSIQAPHKMLVHWRYNIITFCKGGDNLASRVKWLNMDWTTGIQFPVVAFKSFFLPLPPCPEELRGPLNFLYYWYLGALARLVKTVMFGNKIHSVSTFQRYLLLPTPTRRHSMVLHAL